MILKQPPKPRNNETDAVSFFLPSQDAHIKSTTDVNQSPKHKTVEPVSTKKQNNSVKQSPKVNVGNSKQSVTSEQKLRPDVSLKGAKASENGRTVTVDSSKYIANVDKTSKDVIGADKAEDSKEQMLTPKKERYIPPLPRSASKYVYYPTWQYNDNSNSDFILLYILLTIIT